MPTRPPGPCPIGTPHRPMRHRSWRTHRGRQECQPSRRPWLRQHLHLGGLHLGLLNLLD